MPYGIIKVDQVTFTNAGVDQTISVSGIVASISGNITATGTISGNVIRGGTTVSGATVTGTAGQFGTITGNTAGFTTVTGTTVTGITATFTSGVFTNISGGTHTITSGVFASGTAANPSITFQGDVNTGIYSPGAEQVAISTNGSGRLFVNSLGNIGVGSSPTSIGSNISTIHAKGINGAGIGLGSTSYDQSLVLFTNGDGAAGYLGTYANMPLVFTTNSTERLRITSTGNVGIGTSAPGVALDVVGEGRFYSTSSNINLQVGRLGDALFNNSFSIYSGYVTTAASYLIQTDLNGVNTNYFGALRFNQYSSGTTFTERLRIDNSGRLLVGTSTARSNFFNTTQSANIQLEGTSGTALMSLVSNANDVGSNAALILGKTRGTAVGSTTVVQSGDVLGRITFQGSDGTEFVQAADIYAEVDGPPGANDMPGRLVFSTTADGASSPTERMRLDNAGEVNIFAATGRTVFGARSATGAGTTDRTITGIHSATSTTATGTISFQVFTNGNTQNTNNSYAGISDIKLKENIVDSGSQWADIKALQVRKYNFKEETGQETHTQIGLVAQEVELVSPGIVFESPDRDAEGNELGTVTKSVNYSVLYMKAVKALQEAMERIETLEASNADLLVRVSALESKP